MPAIVTGAPQQCRKFITALKEDQNRITKIVRREIGDSPSLVMNKIKDGGVVAFNDNLASIRYDIAEQPYQSYKPLDAVPRDLSAGSMNGVDCRNKVGAFATLVNDIDPNACHGVCTFNFAQGYVEFPTVDFKYAVETPDVCAMDYIRKGREHVVGYFDSMTRAFTRYGPRNYEANLQDLVIRYGQANASVLSANAFDVTTNGWQAPPEYRLSVHFLRNYRQYMIREEALDENGWLEIETTREDALDAIREDQIQRGISCQQPEEQFYSSPRDAYMKRPFITYRGIKFVFNERPVRGYFKPANIVDGNQTYDFVRVYHWKNVVKADGGLGTTYNHDYDKARVNCEGNYYNMVSLAFVINEKSFIRYGLGTAYKAKGGKQVGTSYEVEVIDGPYIANNKANDKFSLYARHFFRFKSEFPELSGAIVYRHSVPDGYVLEATNFASEVITPKPSTGINSLEECGPSADQVATCTDCYGLDSDAEGTCGAADPGLLSVNPCGPVETEYFGETFNLRIRVTRTGGTDGAASVNYAVAAVTAVASTHFTDIPDGVLNWADGEGGDKYIDIPILASHATDDVTFTATFSGEVGADLSECAVVTVTILA